MQPTELSAMPVVVTANVTCGLDVHKDKIDACIRTNDGTLDGILEEKTFSTMRGSLLELRDWIVSRNCFKVLMESTGVFWMPIYFLLEETAHMDVGLGNARHLKNTPGRPKTDKEDARWLSRLCMLGYLLKSFIVAEPFRNLREYTRYHKKLVQERARHVNRIEKLLQMNGFKLSSVLSDITGLSSQRILLKLCEQGSLTMLDVQMALDKRVKKSADEIAYAINGVMKPSSRTLLKKQLEKLATCDKEILEIYQCMVNLSENYKSEIKIISSIPGLSELSAIYVIAEIGTDMSAFKTAGHLTAWAGLAPKGDKSADKETPKKTQKANQYVKTILVECARAATKARSSRLSMWYWSKQKQLGDKKATIAIARKLLCYIYAMLKSGTLYDASLDRAKEEKNKANKFESACKIVDSKKANSDKEYGSEKQNNFADGQTQSNLEANIGVAPVKKRGRPKKNLDSGAEKPNSQPDSCESPPSEERGRLRKSGSSTINSSKPNFA